VLLVVVPYYRGGYDAIDLIRNSAREKIYYLYCSDRRFPPVAHSPYSVSPGINVALLSGDRDTE
jgi:hypothetical protein